MWLVLVSQLCRPVCSSNPTSAVILRRGVSGQAKVRSLELSVTVAYQMLTDDHECCTCRGEAAAMSRNDIVTARSLNNTLLLMEVLRDG